MIRVRPQEFRALHQVSKGYWWHCTQRRIIFDCLHKLLKSGSNLRILDAGCGPGITLNYFLEYGTVYGIDVSDDALEFCKVNGGKNIVKGDLSSLPFKNSTFDIILCLDVLYHQDIKNDKQVITELYNKLKSGGLLILNVCAFEFLKSEFDVHNYTRHRYTRGEIKSLLENAGFSILKLTYWNSLLFPLIASIRLLRKFVPSNKDESDLQALPRSVNLLLILLLRLEISFLNYYNLPFGLSVFGMAKK